jgi:hypothetical protein
MLRRLAFLVAILPVSGCNVLGLDGRCGPESREVLSSIEPTPLVQHGQFSIVESEVAPRRTLGWLVQSGRLKGRIERASLVERGSGRLLAPLPVMVGTDDIALQDPGPLEYAGPVAFDQVFQLTREERTALLLETTLPETPRLELPLLLYADKPWSQPYCS